MEDGRVEDAQNATFSIADEDYTLANPLRIILNQDPRVSLCSLKIPHPSEARVNVRIQTTGDPATEVLKDACQNLKSMCERVSNVFDDAFATFKRDQASKKTKTKTKTKTRTTH